VGVIDRPGYKQYEQQVSDSFKTFWLLDAAVNYRPVKNMNLFFKVNNIFDRLYTEVPYDMRTPGGDRWYSQPGRFFLTVQFTFCGVVNSPGTGLKDEAGLRTGR
jgi:outer membrane receptor protein involved in Fe transport